MCVVELDGVGDEDDITAVCAGGLPASNPGREGPANEDEPDVLVLDDNGAAGTYVAFSFGHWLGCDTRRGGSGGG